MPGLLLDMESQSAPVAPKAPEYGFVVSHQKLELEIDFSTQSLTGRTEITILPQTKDLRTVRIDARQCQIPQMKITVNGLPVQHMYEDHMKALEIPSYVLWDVEQHDQQRDRLKPLTENIRANGALQIPIPSKVSVEEVDPFSDVAAIAVTQRALGASAARTSSIAVDLGAGQLAAVTPSLTPKTAAEQSARYQPLVISIPFSIPHFRDGLHFVGLNEGDTRFPHVYSKHSMDSGTASSIFPCVDDAAMRCTWEISITCSRTLGDALSRRAAPKVSPGNKAYTNGVVNGVVPEEDFDIPLSEEEKLLEMAIICSGEAMNEIDDPNDSSKKVASFICSNIVAPQHIGFAIGPFEQVDLAEYREVEDGEKLGQGQALPLFAYCLPGRTPEVRHVCLAMAHALDWFTLSFAAYPFSDYTLVFVDDQVNDTEHTASLSICSNRLLFGPEIIDPEMDNTRAIVHAIACQWIGVSIVANQRVDRWLTLGLSHFMTGLFMKTICGNNDYMFRQKTLSDRLVELDCDRPSLHALGEILHLGRFEMDFMILKAPLVLFILDKRLVKATGTAGLTRIISKLITQANIGTSADSVVSTESFRRMCEKITRYRQTETFWNQWVHGAGCPKFVIGQKFNKKRLCVEMTISQKQASTPAGQRLEKRSFAREFKEDINGVYAGELQSVFTGPMTIRIHEADGTPYEHIVEIREGVARIEIPYNTKYKRLKRSRRQKERLNTGAPLDILGEGGDDALYYCLGDVLQSQNDMQEWGLVDWDAETEARMDGESYEWIRMDADFEWLCDKSFSQMPAYMYVSQLQQDRDVVAQQESMLYLKNMNPHPLVSTFLVRTVMDTRYFHGIRTMAVENLKTHANVACNWAGLRHLEKACSEFFCYSGTMMPRSNDFTDRRAYRVELAIPRSMSNIRDTTGNCPKAARQFILDQLRFNDNTNNDYSDNFKVANLLSALANSLIPKKAAENALLGDDDEDIDPEPAQFRQMVIDELDRHRRMDEWINSYQNIFTTTVLDCKLRLMKHKVIPLQAADFAQYLHDGTSENIRIKAFEALVELGLMTNHYVLKLLLNVLSSDPSPYVRTHLLDVFFLGLASVAFAEFKPEAASAAQQAKDVLDEVEDGLVVEQDVSAGLEARKAYIARTTTIEGALLALKDELQNNLVLRDAIWNAIESSIIGLNEQMDLLDICAALFDTVESMIIKLQWPRYWRVRNLGKGHMQFTKTNRVRTRPLKAKAIVQSKPLASQVPTTLKLATAKPSTSRPSLSVNTASKSSANSVRLSFNNSAGAMKPPKRPLERDQSEDLQPRRKIIKLSIPGAKLDAIVRSAPAPQSTIRASPTITASPVPRPSPAVSASPSTTSASPAPSSVSGPVKIRRPLPDSAPKTHPESPQLTKTPSFKIKLNTKPKPSSPL